MGRLDDAMHVVSRVQSLGAPMQSGAVPLIRAEAEMRAGRPREAARLLARTMQQKARGKGAQAVLEQVYEAYRNQGNVLRRRKHSGAWSTRRASRPLTATREGDS
jgi:predicted Zn-dependent protease